MSAAQAKAAHDLAHEMVGALMFEATQALATNDVSGFRVFLNKAQKYTAQYREALEWTPPLRLHPDELTAADVAREEAGGAA